MLPTTNNNHQAETNFQVSYFNHFNYDVLLSKRFNCETLSIRRLLRQVKRCAVDVDVMNKIESLSFLLERWRQKDKCHDDRNSFYGWNCLKNHASSRNDVHQPNAVNVYINEWFLTSSTSIGDEDSCLFTYFAIKPLSSPTQLQASSSPSSWKHKSHTSIGTRGKIERKIESILQNVSLSFGFSDFFPLLHSSDNLKGNCHSAYEFTLKINQTYCPRKNIFLFSLHFHFEKFFLLFLFLHSVCIWDDVIFFASSVDGIRTEFEINQWIAQWLFLSCSDRGEKHFTPKDLKLLFAVFHIKPHDDVVDT